MSKILDTLRKGLESSINPSKDVWTGSMRTDVGLLPDSWGAELLGDLFVFKGRFNRAKRFFGTGTPVVNYMDVFERPDLRSADLAGRVNLGKDT